MEAALFVGRASKPLIGLAINRTSNDFAELAYHEVGHKIVGPVGDCIQIETNKLKSIWKAQEIPNTVLGVEEGGKVPATQAYLSHIFEEVVGEPTQAVASSF